MVFLSTPSLVQGTDRTSSAGARSFSTDTRADDRSESAGSRSSSNAIEFLAEVTVSGVDHLVASKRCLTTQYAEPGVAVTRGRIAN